MTDPSDASGVTITVRDNAFLRISGPITLLDGQGNAFDVEAGKIVTLCRCGGSATKPFCDSSHRTNGFASIVRADAARTARELPQADGRPITPPRPSRPVPRVVRHNLGVNAEDLRLLSADLLMTLLFGAAFVALFVLHRWDLRRRRRRVAALRAAGDFGPNSAAVASVVAAAGGLDATAAGRLAVERRRAFEWDPRLDKIPKVARHARDRAFASERDDVAMAASDEARDAVRAALDGTPPAELEERVRLEAAECAAETAGAIAAVDRLSATEFRMLTRAWRTVVGPIGVAPPREQ